MGPDGSFCNYCLYANDQISCLTAERCTYSLVQVLMNQYGVLTIFHPLYLRYLSIRLLRSHGS